MTFRTLVSAIIAAVIVQIVDCGHTRSDEALPNRKDRRVETRSHAYGIDQLAESMVRVVSPAGATCGSGFVIRRDGYIVTCHHVICDLPRIDVEYRGKKYCATWVEHLSRPDADLAGWAKDVQRYLEATASNPKGLERNRSGNCAGAARLI